MMESILISETESLRHSATTTVLKKNAFIASFFFHRRGEDLQHSKLGFLRSLLHQILGESPTLLSDFCRDTRFEDKAGRCWTKNDLEERLLHFIEYFTKTRSLRLYIDVLDESGEVVATHLAGYFKKIVKNCPRFSGICVSCRPWPQAIETGDLHIVVEDGKRTDIETYLDKAFENMVPRRSQSDLEEIKAQLAARASRRVSVGCSCDSSRCYLAR